MASAMMPIVFMAMTMSMATMIRVRPMVMPWGIVIMEIDRRRLVIHDWRRRVDYARGIIMVIAGRTNTDAPAHITSGISTGGAGQSQGACCQCHMNLLHLVTPF
jgi:hypothetical protein